MSGQRDSVILDESQMEARPLSGAPLAAGAPALLGRVLQGARALGECAALDEFLERLARLAADLTGADRAAAFLAPPDGAALAAGQVHTHNGVRAGEPIAVSATLARAALAATRALWVPSVGEDPRFKGRPSLARGRVASAVAARIPGRERAAGLLYVDSQAEGALTADHAAALEALAEEVGPLLEKHCRLDLARRALAASRERFPPPRIIGDSPAVVALRKDLERLAPLEASVLLTGETGTGKELAAQSLHTLGARGAGPFVAFNCAAVPESLFEAELFGHEKGAFTGAHQAKPGRFEAADGGVLFLDEIGELAPSVQAKLLRVLEERVVRRVGGLQGRPVDVRIVSATHRDLRKEIAEGRFREDLFYRLAVVTVRVPPLRERGDDVVLLARHFLEKHGEGRVTGWNAAFEKRLRAHTWPGNIRELSNEIARAAALGFPASAAPAAPLRSLSEVEADHIRAVLATTSWKKGEALKILGISWPTLNRKLEEYRIEP